MDLYGVQFNKISDGKQITTQDDCKRTNTATLMLIAAIIRANGVINNPFSGTPVYS